MEAFLTQEGLVALFTLSILEIVLGIDNIIFISIIVDRLPKAQQRNARIVGLALALVFRIVMLNLLVWMMSLVRTLFSIGSLHITGKDLILLGGGIFLLIKTIDEMRHKVLGHAEKKAGIGSPAGTFASIIIQIILIDIVFSFDSILTAVGLSKQVPIMVAAVVISMVVMLVFSGGIAKFINTRPTVKMLALAFLLLIGGMLVAEGLHIHVEKSYIYFAMAFSLGVDALNRAMLRRAKAQ